MAEYLANQVQQVALNSAVQNFVASIPCNRGNVYHNDGSGIFILRGPRDGQCYATYNVLFSANVGIPEGSTAGVPIALALSVNGEEWQASRGIFFPTITDETGAYGNIICPANIKVPRGCCFNVAVRYVAGTSDPTVTPAPVIDVQNASLQITRTS